MTRDTSIEAYNAIVAGGLLNRMRTVVYRSLYEHGPATGHEMDELLATQDAHKRLPELREAGVVREVGRRPCSVTGRNAILWDVTSRLPVPETDVKRANSLREGIAKRRREIVTMEAELERLVGARDSQLELAL